MHISCRATVPELLTDYTSVYGYIWVWKRLPATITGCVTTPATQWSNERSIVSFLTNVRELTDSQISNGQQITSKGFQFLLYTPHEQLWDLLLQYLHMTEVGNWRYR
jgi:hypothetical protein